MIQNAFFNQCFTENLSVVPVDDKFPESLDIEGNYTADFDVEFSIAIYYIESMDIEGNYTAVIDIVDSEGDQYESVSASFVVE